MPRPSALPEWASSPASGDILEPSAGRKASGWVRVNGVPEKPPYQTFNWYQERVYRWIQWFDENISTGLTATPTFAALTVTGVTTLSSVLIANAQGIESATASSVLNVGTGANTSTLNIGTGSNTQIVNIGTGSGVTTINLGGPGDTVAIAGTLLTVNTTDLDVFDKFITLNKGGTAGSAGLSGLAFEEAGSVAGYHRITSARTGFESKAPATAGVLTWTLGAQNPTLDFTGLTAARSFSFPDSSATLVGAATTQSLTNKTISLQSNTITGRTSGSPGSGELGQVIGASISSTTVGTSDTDITGASLTLSSGTWIIYYSVAVTVTCGGGSVGNASYIKCVLTDSANTKIDLTERALEAYAQTSTAMRARGCLSAFAVVSPTSSTTYKLRGQRGDVAGTGSAAQILTSGALPGYDSQFIATRIG